MKAEILDIPRIVEMLGGNKVVAEHVGLTVSMVRNKWPESGIQDKHWPRLIELAGSLDEELTPTQIFEANQLARKSSEEEGAAA
ncbi:MAG: hypothetical protein ACPG4X_14540 [Pikeienuella sp.]